MLSSLFHSYSKVTSHATQKYLSSIASTLNFMYNNILLFYPASDISHGAIADSLNRIDNDRLAVAAISSTPTLNSFPYEGDRTITVSLFFSQSPLQMQRKSMRKLQRFKQFFPSSLICLNSSCTRLSATQSRTGKNIS